jgi:O-antigen ligase
MTKKERTLYILILLFIGTLYFHKTTSINVILTGAVFIYSFMFNTWQEKLEILKNRRHVQAMLFFFLFLVISFFLSDNHKEGLHHLKIRLPLLLFPLSIGLLYLRREFKDKILLAFASFTTVVSLLCLLASIYQYFTLHRADIFYNDNLTLLLKQQSIYVALLVNIAVYIFGYFLFFTQARHKPLMVLAVVFLFGISFLLASRVNLAVLGGGTLAFLLYYCFSRKKILEGLTLVIGLAIGSYMAVKFKPAALQRFKELSFTKFNFENMGEDSHFNKQLTAEQWNGANFRLAAWACGWEVFKENPVIGAGLGDKDDALREKYKQKNFRFALQHDRNVHNNYLDILFGTGLIGFCLFLAGWVIFPILKALRYRDGLAVFIILTIAFAWITEVYFSRNFGTMIVSFLIPFLLTDKAPVKDVEGKK